MLGWLQPPAAERVLLRYEDLARDPQGSVVRTISQLLPGLQRIGCGDSAGSADLVAGSGYSVAGGQTIPTFDELHRIDGGFFRRGVTGTHVDELPDEMHQLFWSRSENIAAMTLLGFETN